MEDNLQYKFFCENSATLCKFIKDGVLSRIQGCNYEPIKKYRQTSIFGEGAVFSDNIVSFLSARYPIIDNEEKTEELKEIIFKLNQNSEEVTEEVTEDYKQLELF